VDAAMGWKSAYAAFLLFRSQTMPLGPWATFQDCVDAQMEKGYPEENARRICGYIKQRIEKKDDSMLIVSKSSDEQKYTLGVVYEPDEVDTQGEFAKAEDIQDAAWAFMQNLQVLAKSAMIIVKASEKQEVEVDVTELTELVKGVPLDDEHLQLNDAELGVVVESYLAPMDMKIDGQSVKKGAWLLGVRWSDAMWQKVKNGERTGFSMYGRASRVRE
jgi:hypothetical protein